MRICSLLTSWKLIGCPLSCSPDSSYLNKNFPYIWQTWCWIVARSTRGIWSYRQGGQPLNYWKVVPVTKQSLSRSKNTTCCVTFYVSVQGTTKNVNCKCSVFLNSDERKHFQCLYLLYILFQMLKRCHIRSCQSTDSYRMSTEVLRIHVVVLYVSLVACYNISCLERM